MPWRCCQWHQQGCTGSLSQEIAELKPCVKKILTKGDPGPILSVNSDVLSLEILLDRVTA